MSRFDVDVTAASIAGPWTKVRTLLTLGIGSGRPRRATLEIHTTIIGAILATLHCLTGLEKLCRKLVPAFRVLLGRELGVDALVEGLQR